MIYSLLTVSLLQWYGAAPRTFDDDVPSPFGKNIPLPGAFSWSGQYINEESKDGVISWGLRTKMKAYQKSAIWQKPNNPFCLGLYNFIFSAFSFYS